MPEVVSDVILTPARIWYAPVGTALPAQSLAAGAAWPSGWVYIGYTLEQTDVTYEFTEKKIEVEQALAPIRITREDESVLLETLLAQHSGVNMSLALGGALTTIPAGASQPQVERVTFGGDVNIPVNMWGIEGTYVDEDGATFPIRTIIYRGSASEGGKYSYARKEVAGIPLKIIGQADTARAVGAQLFEWYRVIEPATS